MSCLSLADKSRTSTLRKEGGGTSRSVRDDALLLKMLQKVVSQVNEDGDGSFERVEEQKGEKHAEKVFHYEDQGYEK
jgi:hypothetical protein